MSESTALTLREKTASVIETLQHPSVLEQIKELLPDNVPLTRFVGVAKTAIRSNPDLVSADQTTLFAAIIRCAQAGLFPDGHEAALVIYKGKASFLPMIDGARKTLAEFGWLLRTGVVYANDEFEYTDEPATITHRSVRPGAERGPLVAAYGIATHADGRRLQRVLHPDEIAKRRALAQTQQVWDKWEPQMWMKSAGHAVAGDVPLAESDRARLERAFADVEPADAAALLYGDVARAAFNDPPADTAAEPPAAAPAPVPVETDEPEPQPPAEQPAVAIGETVIPNGAYQGMTLAQLADTGEDGTKWIIWALTHPSKLEDGFHAALETFVETTLPDLAARYHDWQASRTAAA